MKHIFFIILLYTGLLHAQIKDSTKSQNISVICVEKGNIVYRGINNPIKIAVPGAKSFTASAPGLEKTDDNGNYNFNVTPLPGDSVAVKVEIVMHDNTIKSEFKMFRIEHIKFKTVINGQNCIGCIVELTKKQLIQGDIGVKSDSYYYEVPTVKTIEIIYSGKKRHLIEGNKIDKETISEIHKLKTGTIIYLQVYTTYRLRVQPIKIMIIDEPKTE